MSDKPKRYKGFFAKFAVILFSLFIFLILRYIEHSASVYLSFYIFYLIPVILVAWFVSERGGLIFSIVSLLVWVFDDFQDVRYIGHSVLAIKVWNQILKFVFICFFIYLIGSIKQLLNKLKQFDRSKSQFVANVSHELRNALFNVKESLAIVLDGIRGEIEPGQREVLEIGKSNIDRLLRLVTDLLDISKIEAGKMELKIEEIDVAALSNEVSKSFEANFLKKSITFKLDVARDIGLLFGDRDKILGVIINLLSNAVKYTPQNGSVVLTVNGDADSVRFAISDSGPGIPKDYREKIFDKFERIMTEKQEGTGLGLPIAKDVVLLHKGRIWVEGEVGEGSTFVFVIPRNFKNISLRP
jgi:signal transduction histidine kinase